MKNSLPLVLIVVAIFCGIGRAANIHFLPGDAFFPTELTAEQLAELRKGDPKKFAFNHSSYEEPNGFFCGSAGHSSVQFEDIDQKFVEQLIVAYKQMRSHYAKQFIEQTVEGKVILRETNPMRVLFYPAEFDYPKYELGIQYNENWAEETQKFGYEANHLRFLSLVSGEAAIIESWQRSKEVGTFKFDFPKVKQDPETGFSNPIIMKGPIKAIVLPALPLKDFVMGGRTSDVRVVEPNGVFQYEAKKKEDGSEELVKVRAK